MMMAHLLVGMGILISLFMYGAGPGALHTTDKLIRTPEDMKGMRIRRPSAVAGDIIESAGAW